MANRLKRSSQCGCTMQVYGEEYDSGEIKQPAQLCYDGFTQCIYKIEPASRTSLSMSIESISMRSDDGLGLYQYVVSNSSEVNKLFVAQLSSVHRQHLFTASVGAGFWIEYSTRSNYWRGSSDFTMSFNRVDAGISVCPFPLLFASSSFQAIPAIERPGPLRCPFCIAAGVPGRKIYLSFNSMGGAIFHEVQAGDKIRTIPSTVTRFLSTSDTTQFVLESLAEHVAPRFNITFKELAVDPCFCDSREIVIGDEPVLVTSPGFPDIYCSDFRCRRRFTHNNTMLHSLELTFVVNIHLVSTERFDYLEFFSDGIAVERLNGTLENVRLALTGDVMETEFVTDNLIVEHGYSMTVQSVRVPIECLCPHKGVKTMQSTGSARMDIAAYCKVVYCKWRIPSSTTPLKFVAMFNFTSERDAIAVRTGDDVRQYSTISGKLSRRHWKVPGNSPETTILYQRSLPENSTEHLEMASFTVNWMRDIEDCACDKETDKGAIVGEWYELTSPAYPLSYCDDMECVTRITAPVGHHVVLNITDFYTEPYNDVLALFDGRNITGRHMDVLYGHKRFPYLIRNTNETMSLVFKSDHEISYHGFRLLYSAEPNDELHAVLHQSSRASIAVIVLLSVLLVATLLFAVYRRLPRRFDNPLYVASFSHSEQTTDTNDSNDVLT